MTNKFKVLYSSIILLVGLSLAGCGQQGPNETMGTVIGGIGGGLLGSQIGGGSGNTAATIGGAAIGAAIGGSVGNNMDRVDNLNLNNALQNQRDNKSTTWVNPNSNKRYTVTPTTTSNDGDNYCRDYSMNTIIDGQSQTVTGRACRVNGRWVKQ